METPGYTTLTRQSGLMREFQIIANNIANASTSGYRREALVFSEYVSRLPQEPSLSMAHGNARYIDLSQAGLAQTGGTYDLALQGEGFFLVLTPDGERLTRSGAFSPSAEGVLVTPQGHALLDTGGAPVVAPVGARQVAIAPDGTVSADGVAMAQIGVWQPSNPVSLRHQAGTLFSADGQDPAENTRILQGFVEESNVQPVAEVARMIEVQRAYELGQTFLDAEDQRQRNVIQALGR